jgi:hypothetical protein
MSVTLAQASTIVDAALKKARELKQMPQTAHDDAARGAEPGFSHRHRKGEHGAVGAKSGGRADHDVGDAVTGDTDDNDEITAVVVSEAATLKTDSDGSKK